MLHVVVLTLLFYSHAVLAQNAVTEFSHWQPSVQLNLYDQITELEKKSLNLEETIQQVDAENERALSKLRNWPWGSTNRKKYMSNENATELLRQMAAHPVVGRNSWKIYDPELRFGFCFGRATWAWLEAIQQGYDKSSIKKIFLVGPMKTGTISWQFHVATAVRSRGLFRDEWLVIDSNFEKVMTVPEFFEAYKKFSTDQKLRLIVTEPNRLGPSSTTKFGPGHFRNPLNDSAYNQYFQDLVANLSKRVNYKHTNKCRYLF